MILLNSIPATITTVADTVATITDTMTSTVTEPAHEVATTTSTSLSIWDLCLEGGFIMIPLALLSILAIYVFI